MADQRLARRPAPAACCEPMPRRQPGRQHDGADPGQPGRRRPAVRRAAAAGSGFRLSSPPTPMAAISAAPDRQPGQRPATARSRSRSAWASGRSRAGRSRSRPSKVPHSSRLPGSTGMPERVDRGRPPVRCAAGHDVAPVGDGAGAEDQDGIGAGRFASAIAAASGADLVRHAALEHDASSPAAAAASPGPCGSCPAATASSRAGRWRSAPRGAAANGADADMAGLAASTLLRLRDAGVGAAKGMILIVASICPGATRAKGGNGREGDGFVDGIERVDGRRRRSDREPVRLGIKIGPAGEGGADPDAAPPASPRLAMRAAASSSATSPASSRAMVTSRNAGVLQRRDVVCRQHAALA